MLRARRPDMGFSSIRRIGIVLLLLGTTSWVLACRDDAASTSPSDRLLDASLDTPDETHAAQTCMAVGQVSDARTGEPISGAELEIAAVAFDDAIEAPELSQNGGPSVFWPPASVGPSYPAHTDDAGEFIPRTDQEPHDPTFANTLLRIDVSVPGYEPRRFYRLPPTDRCSDTSRLSLTLRREGTAGGLFPDLLIDPRRLTGAEVASGAECLDVVPSGDGVGPLSSLCLRHAVGVANVGAGDLHLTAPLGAIESPQQHIDDGEGAKLDVDVETAFIDHAGHGHVHLDNWVEPRLRRVDEACETWAEASACPVVRRGDKISFCLADTDSFDEDLVREGQRDYDCGVDAEGKRTEQGIGAGRVDVYAAMLPGQGIDLTGLEAGAYWLEVEVNPGGAIQEETRDNNVSRIRVDIAHPSCGDGAAGEDEACDGDDLREQTCRSLLEGFAGGTLGCSPSCTLDRSQCEPAACPTTELGGELGQPVARAQTAGADNLRAPRRCATSDTGSDVTYRWTAPSSGIFLFDTLGSDYDTVLYALRDNCRGPELKCNDDARNGQDTIPASRMSLELERGQSVVLVVDSKGESGEHVLNIEQGGVCGNGIAEGHERCDGNDHGGLDCRAVGFAGGTFACSPLCEIDTSGCTLAVCGDGVAQPLAGPAPNGEECDGDDLLDSRCETLGFAGGNLSCTDSCRFDLSACTDS